jgi:cation diffusion facilitator CzcD-associated flavoprotein CzcO
MMTLLDLNRATATPWPQVITTVPDTTELIDRSDRTLIIGAGPGGLSAAAAMKVRDVRFDIVDAGRQVGGIWDIGRLQTPMYESAHFISSKTLSGFPGFPMPEAYPDYPRHDQILRYVQSFAAHHDLQADTQLQTRVLRAQPEAEGSAWRVTLSDGTLRRYGALCVATGTTWHPAVPDFSGKFEGEIYHSFHYREPEEFRGKRVLIVGGGNSGCDIACDAARTAKRAFISLRRGYHFVPKYVFGKPADVFAHAGPQLPGWLEERVFGLLMRRVLVGDLTRYGLQAPDHRILQSHPIMNTQILHYLGHGDLEARPDIREMKPHSVVFTDGSEAEVDLVLLATGFERVFPFFQPDDGAHTREEERIGASPAELYLDVFHRTRETLFFMGLFETDGAAYGLFGLQADLIAGYLADRSATGKGARRLDEFRATHHPDLFGGRSYLPTRRHQHYVKADVYEKMLTGLRKRLGWS